MTTNWQQDFAEQGHRYALFINELLAELDSKPAPGSAAQLRTDIEQWFTGARKLVSAFRAILRFASIPFPYFASERIDEAAVIHRRKSIQNELILESQHVSQQKELLDDLERNEQLMKLFQLVYADIGCDFSAGRYGGGRFALTVLHPAARDVLCWLHRVCLRYDFDIVLPDVPAVDMDQIGYREIPPGEEPAKGYYAVRRHMQEFKQLLANYCLTESDLEEINARLYLEESKIERILDQKQQHEELLLEQQQAREIQRRLMMAIEKQEQVKTHVTPPQPLEVQPQAAMELPKTDSKTPRRRKSKADPEHLVEKLRRKISEDYVYRSYSQLNRDIGGANGTWTKIFKDPKNADLVDWRDNRSVSARNSLVVEQAGYEDEMFLPDDELEKLFAEQVKLLPKKERGQAWEQFRSMSPDLKRKFIAGSRS